MQAQRFISVLFPLTHRMCPLHVIKSVVARLIIELSIYRMELGGSPAKPLQG